MLQDILAAGQNYGAIVVMLVISALLVSAMLFLSWLLGPGQKGRIKGGAYESGIDPTGTARKPFHARFYLVAVLFLIFDVELIFFYPWALAYHDALQEGAEAGMAGYLLLAMGVFTLLLIVAFIYEWAKGVLDWR